MQADGLSLRRTELSYILGKAKSSSSPIKTCFVLEALKEMGWRPLSNCPFCLLYNLALLCTAGCEEYLIILHIWSDLCLISRLTLLAAEVMRFSWMKPHMCHKNNHKLHYYTQFAWTLSTPSPIKFWSAYLKLNNDGNCLAAGFYLHLNEPYVTFLSAHRIIWQIPSF